jgi:glycosyltransferase involved in cell wall biosynthesis
MRVTHIITRLVIGGAQENTLATVRGLRARPGLDVKLISGPTTGPEGSLEKTAQEIFNGAENDFTIVPELVRPVHPLKDFRALRKLEKILRTQSPDIVHTHSGKAGILGRLAAKRAGVPVIIHHIHGPSFGNFQGAAANFIFTAAEKYAGKVTDHFIVVAEAMQRRYLAAGIRRAENYTKIFSGFPIEPFLAVKPETELRRQLGFAPDDFVIGQVARFAPRKGQADLLKAFCALLPDCPHARLLFVGDGWLRGELERQVKNLGLNDKVVFTGLVPPDDVPRHLGVMDCLAHLSSFPEGLPRALPQALAAGKPVVAYDFDGAAEVCRDNETGFLIRTGDTDMAAKKLLLLAKNPALREKFGRCGSQFVQENFSVEKMVADQYDLYLKLVAGRGLRA